MSTNPKHKNKTIPMEQDLEIIDTLSISPSPPPPLSSTLLPLSRLDSDRRSPFRTLRLYSPSSPSRSPSYPYGAFAAALSKALHHFYPLAGTLPSGALAVRCSTTDTVPLTLAACPRPLGSFQTEPSSDFLNRLAPDLGSGNVLALQLTRFSCGGLALGMCVHHAMCDGAGAGKFLSAVAGFARGVDRIALEPVWDRLGLLGPRRPPRVEVDFGEYLGFGEDNGPYSEGTVLRECFHVSEDSLNRFRNQLKAESGSSFTSFEALTTFIWRSRVKASGIAEEEVVKFIYSMNIAKLLKPALPDGYWGNVIVPVFMKLTVRDLLQQSVCETAKLIKKSKHDVTDEYVRSYLDFLELHHEKGITAGRSVSGFTDWRHIGHSEADFGWGSPSTVLPLTWRILGSSEPTYFLPYPAGDAKNKEGFKVLVCLRENAMASFRSEMEMFA